MSKHLGLPPLKSGVTGFMQWRLIPGHCSPLCLLNSAVALSKVGKLRYECGRKGKIICLKCGGKWVLFEALFHNGFSAVCLLHWGRREKGRLLPIAERQLGGLLDSTGGSLHHKRAVFAFIWRHKGILSSCLMSHLLHPSCILSQQQQCL